MGRLFPIVVAALILPFLVAGCSGQSGRYPILPNSGNVGNVEYWSRCELTGAPQIGGVDTGSHFEQGDGDAALEHVSELYFMPSSYPSPVPPYCADVNVTLREAPQGSVPQHVIKAWSERLDVRHSTTGPYTVVTDNIEMKDGSSYLITFVVDFGYGRPPESRSVGWDYPCTPAPHIICEEG